MSNLATQQVGQQANTLQNISGNNQNLVNSDVSSLNNQNSANEGIASQNTANQAATFKSVTNAASNTQGILAHGGEVKAPQNYDEGGPVQVETPDAPTSSAPNAANSKTAQLLSSDTPLPAQAPAPKGDEQSSAGKTAQSLMQDSGDDAAADAGTTAGADAAGAAGADAAGAAATDAAGAAGAADAAGAGAAAAGGADAGGLALLALLAKGGKVPALVSPGEVYIPPSKVKQAAKSPDPTKHGQKVPGKAKVKGDSYANDTVHATLQEGGIVIPKSVMESKHPAWAAHKFVTAITAKTKLRKK